MPEPFIGEIRMFAGSFSPQGWNFCDGSLLSISDNDVLFQLIGTTYGGDGQSTFGLPDLRGRVPVHQGNSYLLGQQGGVESVSLDTGNLPTHSHPLSAAGVPGDSNVPTGDTVLSFMGPSGNSQTNIYKPYDGQNQVMMHPASIGIAGGNTPHDNIQPTLAINFIIALQGMFPPQS